MSPQYPGQSVAQLYVDSYGEQTPSPQNPGQSDCHDNWLSPDSHTPLPHTGVVCPQSLGHEYGDSPASQIPLPQ